MANLITLIRMIFAFIVVGLLCVVNQKVYIAAAVLTAIVIWFDGLDGYVARKFNEVSKFGALWDIMGDRVVEMVYWIIFAVLGWVPVWFPIIVVTRGFIVDGFRSIAFEKGYTAFGSSTMMQSKLGKFIVASNFSRGSYAVAKAFAFVFLIVGNIPAEFSGKHICLTIGVVCAYISIVFCVLRGLPVLIESKRFFE